MLRETWVGLGWAATFTVAMIGVFAFEYATADGDVQYRIYQESFIETQEGVLQVGESAVVGHSVARDGGLRTASVTAITATLVWEDDIGDPDRFTVTLVVEGAEEMGPFTESGDEGNLVATLACQHETPTPTRAADPRRAVNKAAPDACLDVTKIEVIVTLDDAPGQDLGVPLDGFTGEDGEQRFHLELSAVVLRAEPA